MNATASKDCIRCHAFGATERDRDVEEQAADASDNGADERARVVPVVVAVIPVLVMEVDAADACEDGTGGTEPGDLDGQWPKRGERITECVVGLVDDEQRYQRDQVAHLQDEDMDGHRHRLRRRGRHCTEKNGSALAPFPLDSAASSKPSTIGCSARTGGSFTQSAQPASWPRIAVANCGACASNLLETSAWANRWLSPRVAGPWPTGPRGVHGQ
jgi:hypothetical protein